MSYPREGPNPLRPYYIPPSIGIPANAGNPTSSATHAVGLKNGSAASYASSARDIFIDIDYTDYLSDSSPGTMAQIKNLLDEALYKYTSVLLAQPFEVGKTILQVRNQATTDGIVPVVVAEDIRRKPSSYRESIYSDYPSDDSDHEEAYFTSAAPSSQSYTHSRSRRRRDSDRTDDYMSQTPSDPASPTSAPAHKLNLKRVDAVMEVISQEWTKEGAWGVWKASNATFFYSVLLKMFEGWSRGLLSAAFNVPDPGTMIGLGASIDVIDSQYPWASLGVAVGGAVMAGILLAPLDIIRTKLILTPISTPKRSITQNLKALPSYICPSAIMIPTILHSLVSPAISHATPLFLRSRLSIDPVLTPTTYSLATFLSSTAELFIKLPIETVLRRGQMAVLASPEYHTSSKDLETMVDVGPYRGLLGTMWSIVREEGGSSGQEAVLGTGGARAVRKNKKAERKGQGMEGLWRGWRVGMWGLVGMWGAAAMGSSGSHGGEF